MKYLYLEIRRKLCYISLTYETNKMCPKFIPVSYFAPIPVAARFKAWACGSSLAGIVGLNPAGVMDICLL
jgi:hypothetical protein